MLGNPRDRRTGVYCIRPFGWPVIECFLGDPGRMVEEVGPAAGFAHATISLQPYSDRPCAQPRPLVASRWSRMTHIGGAYSYALPGAPRHGEIWPVLSGNASSNEDVRIRDYSTAHGRPYDNGVRAAEENDRSLDVGSGHERDQARVEWFVFKQLAEQATRVDRSAWQSA